MLVKGGSSFNALVRAMRQDIVESGSPAAKDPNVLYDIDKLSMQNVRAGGQRLPAACHLLIGHPPLEGRRRSNITQKSLYVHAHSRLL